MNPDWTLLPLELLQTISEKVSSISDFVCFRAVCNTWRSASSPRPRHLPPQLPWLILPRGRDEENKHSSMLCLYDLSQSRTHILDLPEIKGKDICSSSNGWLILEDQEVCLDQDVWLFNPITRDQITLPSLYAEPNLYINLFGKNSKDYLLSPGMEIRIRKVILSSNPGIDPDCLVMALFEEPWELAFCRIGDDCWTVISEFVGYASDDNVVDIGYHNGLFYAINCNRHVRICDVRSPSYKVINPERQFLDFCIVEGGCDLDGLMVLCSNTSRLLDSPINTDSIVVWCDKHERWLDVVEEHLSNNIVFMGYGRQMRCTSLPVANLMLEEWGGNYMCGIFPQLKRIDDEDRYSFSIRLVGLNNGTERTLASHVGLIDFGKYELDVEYFSPSFFWLVPSLC